MPGFCNETGKGPYRYMRPVWKASVAVNPGDMVYRDTAGYDQPAANFTWDTNIATTSAEFHNGFRGISTAKRMTTGSNQTVDGDRGHGGILSSGEFRYPLDVAAAAIQVVGSFVSVAKAAGNALLSQTVTLTATISNSIGRLTEDVRIGDLYATLEIEPMLSPWSGVLAYYANGASFTVGVTASAPTG